MFKNYDVTIDTTKNVKNNAIAVNTNDLKTLKFSFKITQSGHVVDLTGSTVRIAIRKPDKLTVFQDCTITTAAEGECEVVLDTQAYIVPGLHAAEVMIYYSADTVSVTGRFSYTANKAILDDDSVVSSNEFQSINKAITDVENIVEDLRENGTGVDAQARANLETVTSELAQTLKKSDNGVLGLNVFDENTRNVLQGQVPGTINAVLGSRNVKNENIDYGALDLEKVKDVKTIVGTNLFLKQNAVSGLINITNGAVDPNANYMVTDFIPVKPGDIITSMSGLNTHVYTASKTYRQSWQNTATITVPSNGAFYRTTLNKADLDTFIVVLGSSIPAESGMIPNKYSLSNLKVSEENSTFLTLDRVNLIDETKITSGMALVLADGTLASNPSYSTSDFIPVEVGQIYSQSEQAFKVFYDVNKAFISGTNSFQETAPANSAFIRVSILNANLGVSAMLVKGTQLPEKYESFYAYKLSNNIKSDRYNTASGIASPLSGLKWHALGDSITVGSGSGSTPADSYVTLIANRNQMTATNYGVIGSSISKNPAMNGYQFTTRYVNMTNDADIITVFGGTNDYGNTLPLGVWGDTTDATLYGAMKILVEGLMSKYPLKRIGFILPLPRTGNIAQTGGLKDYVSVIKDVCSRYSIPVLDLYSGSGFAPDFTPNKNALMSDGLHPTPAGQLLMSRKIEAFLRSL